MASLLSKIGAVYRMPLVPDDEALAMAQCEGKHGFQTPQLALAVVLRPRRQRAKAYRCRKCGLYHLGSI